MSSSASSDEEHEENDTDEVSDFDLLNITLATVQLLVKLKTAKVTRMKVKSNEKCWQCFGTAKSAEQGVSLVLTPPALVN